MSLEKLNSDAVAAPATEAVERLHERLGEWLVVTPAIRCGNLERRLGNGTSVVAKLEFLQRTGTFKARGALAVMLGLDAACRAAGVTAVSAGTHAVATAFAAQALGTSAKVVMMRGASRDRVALCRGYGAEVVLADDVHAAFATVERIRQEEGRYLVHPFEGAAIAHGTATVGLELCRQAPAMDAVVVAIGGGGLCSGIASYVKQVRPDCEVIGVEPYGADSMHRSFAAGAPCRLEKVETIADSLGAPFAMPGSYGLCKRFVDRLVRVDDDALRRAMWVLFSDLKVAVEPACAATTAALLGPLRDSLAGKRVALVLCGSNIDWETWERHVAGVRDAA